jgi:hypothetical protein
VEVAGAHSDIGGGYYKKRGLGDASFNLVADFFGKLTGKSILRKIKVNEDECLVHHSNIVKFQTAAALTGRPLTTTRSSSSGKFFSTTGKLVPTTVQLTAQRSSDKSRNYDSTIFRPMVEKAQSNTASLLKQADKDKLALQCAGIIRRMNDISELPDKIPNLAVLSKNITEFAIEF